MISGTLIASDKVKSTDVYSLVEDELGSDDRQGQRSRDLCGDVVRRFSRHGSRSTTRYRERPLVTIRKRAATWSIWRRSCWKVRRRGSEFEWTPDYSRQVDSYYKTPSYWT